MGGEDSVNQHVRRTWTILDNVQDIHSPISQSELGRVKFKPTGPKGMNMTTEPS